MVTSEEQFEKAVIKMQELSKNQDFCIDGNSDEIEGISLEDIRNMEFSNDIGKELILVRTDERLPKDGRVSSPMEGGARYQDGKAYINRNTSHWSVNHMVVSHLMGDFSGRDFVILQPFDEVKDKMLSFEIQDTYFENGVTLSANALILIRENRYDELTEEEKKSLHFIKFKGNESIATDKALILMEKNHK